MMREVVVDSTLHHLRNDAISRGNLRKQGVNRKVFREVRNIKSGRGDGGPLRDEC